MLIYVLIYYIICVLVYHFLAIIFITDIGEMPPFMGAVHFRGTLEDDIYVQAVPG